MARGRPVHLARRGAVYQVRFRLPTALAQRLGLAELRKSLHTSDPAEARRRCLSATAWFREEMERLMQLTSPTRAELESAARNYFAKYTAAEDAPRGYDQEFVAENASYDIHLATEGLAELEAELISRDFGGSAWLAAREMLASLGVDIDKVTPDTRQTALILGARALRELSLQRIHQLSTPDMARQPYDCLFKLDDGVTSSERFTAVPRPAPVPAIASSTTIRAATETFEARQLSRGLARTTITETQRVLKWLGQAFGPDTELARLTPENLRDFRDRLMELDRRTQGRDLPFGKRQTSDPQHRISYATGIKYWRFLQQFFRWAAEDRIISEDPSAVASPPRPKKEKRHSPPPFTTEELQKLFATPVYAGHKSPKRLMEAGECRSRGGHWWSGLLFMHTGLRAGELAQLMPSDFVFDAPVPHLLVREISDEGTAKTVKSASSVRAVPLHPTLIRLGLEDFVFSHAKRRPRTRVFEVFRLGQHRKSEGTTRWWGDYLQKHGLHKPGRSTHVWRHTFIRFLRDAGVAEEDIAALAGHSGPDSSEGIAHLQTRAYGGGYSLERKLSALSRLDFGFDIVAAVSS